MALGIILDVVIDHFQRGPSPAKHTPTILPVYDTMIDRANREYAFYRPLRDVRVSYIYVRTENYSIKTVVKTTV